MTNRDRLIELFKGAESKVIEELNKHLELDEEEWMGIYADYLIANGVICLPCRVGDTVYVIYPDPRYNWGNKELKILELKVHAFRYFNNIMTVEIRGDGNYITWDISCFGVSVFLTPEEAEKALEGYKENM